MKSIGELVRYKISSREYNELNPPEIHYFDIEKMNGVYRMIAGEIIGRGFAAGGGEKISLLSEAIDKRWFYENISKSDCEWVLSILGDSGLSDQERFEKVIELSQGKG